MKLLSRFAVLFFFIVAEEAEAAISALNGKSIDGRALTVNVARPREERSGGGRSSNGGGREYSGARNRY